MVERGDQVVEDEVQLEHLVRALRDVLAENRAAVLANLMRQRHEERSSSRARVVAFDVTQVFAVPCQKTRHNRGDSVRRVVFRVLSAARRVVILDEVLEDVRKKIVMLGKRLFKAEVQKFVHERAGKECPLAFVGNLLGEWLKNRNLRVGNGER